MKRKILLFVLLAGTCTLLSAQIIHVPGDYSTIQEGINATSDGDTVLVANGLYYENFNFSGKAIMVASNFIVSSDTNDINNTIINGSQPDNPDYGSVVTFINNEDTTSVLCGFTITEGTGMLDPIHNARIGGGIVCYYSSAKIIHNKITGNEVNSETAWGAGIASIKETGTNWTIVENNIISSNQSIANSTSATGGGLEVWGNARICNNVIEYNECHCVNGIASGGGIIMESINTPSDTLRLCNNVIRNNLIHSDNSWSPGAGVFSIDSYCLINDNIIENNQAQGFTAAHGGGVEVQFADIMLTSNTIRNNSVVSNYGSYGGGVSFWNSNTYINDNEISGNSVSADEADGGGIHLYHTGKVEVTNNMINHNHAITNNIWLGAGIVCLFPEDSTKFINNNFVGNAGRVYPSGAGGGLCVWEAQETTIILEVGNQLKLTVEKSAIVMDNTQVGQTK